jgi:DNA-binding beta-propeller fold protein YncE
MIAVAAYDSGVVIHDATAPFTARAVFGAGSPSDVAFDNTGRLAAGDTAGDTLQIAGLDPWSVANFSGVPFVDELAFDDSGDLFASDRDSNGSGALTRIAPDGTITRRALGLTSEGVAIDSRRHRVYVANVNDGTISIVDARTMTERARFHAIDRVFSLALSGDGARLYAVSNQSVGSPFSAPGRVVAFDVRGAKAHVAAQSAPLSFPVGIAVDDAHGRVFVTDERDDTVSVLDASTLRSQHRPLPTCRTPWKPTLDPQGQRLYVPCAQADEVDVFDLPSLQRAHGAPFKTGGYPLAVAVWHPDHHVVR